MHSLTRIDPTAPVRDWLRGQSRITAAVGTRVYAAGLPKDCTLPAMSLFRVAGGIDVPLEAGVFQFDCWAATGSGAAAVADALISSLTSAQPQPIGTEGLWIKGCTVQSVNWLPDPDDPDVHHYQVTAQVVTLNQTS